MQARISHKISGQVGEDVVLDLPSRYRDHYRIDKTRGFEDKDDVTDCTNCPRVCGKYGLTGR